jgi:hypothetical protein
MKNFIGVIIFSILSMAGFFFIRVSPSAYQLGNSLMSQKVFLLVVCATCISYLLFLFFFRNSMHVIVKGMGQSSKFILFSFTLLLFILTVVMEIKLINSFAGISDGRSSPYDYNDWLNIYKYPIYFNMFTFAGPILIVICTTLIKMKYKSN